jgi:ribonuclease P protein component
MAAAPQRLKRRAEFLLAAKGRKAPVEGLVLQIRVRGDQGPVRAGFTVTKKIGNAVVRNRVKRRLREVARLELGATAITGTDLVLIGREAAKRRRFADLQDDLRRALRKGGLA